jgi:NAD(P)-dependent dehydrogenase (short-subunit alcohol dehydrogenase family)
MPWRPANMPDLSGRRILVTGATDGLGIETAQALAARGARVILSGRSADKGEAALARIRKATPTADVRFEQAELGDLSAVRALAERVGGEPLDVLINNAGVIGVEPRRTSADGYELQLAVNYLSHFALTGLLLPALLQGRRPRVVSLSSLAHRVGGLHFDDLQLQRSYAPMRAYAQSKLAMLVFAGELQRRSDARGWGLLSLAAHPGGARTNMLAARPGANGRISPAAKLAERIINPFVQSAADGAWPTLFAATAPDAQPGGYYGPSALFEVKGPPAPARRSRAAVDPALGARLWDVSQALTGAPFGSDQ